MLVEQLLILRPWQPRGHCTQCANCCIHHVGIPVQVDLQQGSGTVMAAFDMQGTSEAGNSGLRQMEGLTLGARLQPLGPSKHPNIYLGMRLCCGIEQMQMPDNSVMMVVNSAAHRSEQMQMLAEHKPQWRHQSHKFCDKIPELTLQLHKHKHVRSPERHTCLVSCPEPSVALPSRIDCCRRGTRTTI